MLNVVQDWHFGALGVEFEETNAFNATFLDDARQTPQTDFHRGSSVVHAVADGIGGAVVVPLEKLALAISRVKAEIEKMGIRQMAQIGLKTLKGRGVRLKRIESRIWIMQPEPGRSAADIGSDVDDYVHPRAQ